MYKSILLIFISSFYALAFSQTKDPRLQFEFSQGGTGFEKQVLRWQNDKDPYALFATSSGILPVSFKLDLINKRKFTFGLNVAYTKVVLNYFINNINETNLDVVGIVMERFQRTSFMIRSNYLIVNSDSKFQLYTSLSLGIQGFSHRKEINNSDYSKDFSSNVGIGLKDAAPALFSSPIAIQAYLGTRYYFSKNFGAHMELGYGGALMNAGISWRVMRKNNSTKH
jgi:hypothetical protein